MARQSGGAVMVMEGVAVTEAAMVAVVVVVAAVAVVVVVVRVDGSCG